MTLPAELRAEADSVRASGRPGTICTHSYKHDEATRALLHRAADALELTSLATTPEVTPEDPRIRILVAAIQSEIKQLDGVVTRRSMADRAATLRAAIAALPATPEGE